MGYRLRLSLFIGLIVGPAGVLTFLSLRGALDEQRSALADLRLQVPAIQADLQSHLQQVVEDALADTGRRQGPEVAFVFLLDRSGAFAEPMVLRPVLLTRSAGFSAALQRAEGLEFRAADPLAAGAAYQQALQLAASDAERSEALGALHRCAVVVGDSLQALQWHNRLRDGYAGVLDADGAHALSHSYLRQVRRRLPAVSEPYDEPDSAAIAAGLATTRQWVDGVLAGSLPLHAGTTMIAGALRTRIRRFQARDATDLQSDLARIERRADFVAAYDRLLETAVVRADQTYLSGLGEGGRSWFAVLKPQGEGISGVLLDLDELAAATLATPAGQQVRAAGFSLKLFDSEFRPDFEQQFSQAVRIVSPIDAWSYRLHVGLYSRDEPFVFSHYRNRNALIVAGIAFLAGTIALGAWVLARETTREAQTANLQSEFVANVSHELRTPLTSIRLYAETLLLGRARSDEQRQQYLLTIMRESQRLSRMVANILEFSRIESGRRTWVLEPTDFAAIVQQSIDEFRPMLQEQGFDLVVHVAQDLPLVAADPEGLETATANLLSNAVRYSPDRRQVEVRLEASDGQVSLEVADRGVGVPRGEVDRIFAKYQRGSNAPGVAQGTGLGLALVAGIAASHGGTVTCRSRSGGGTVFRLTLPVARS